MNIFLKSPLEKPWFIKESDSYLKTFHAHQNSIKWIFWNLPQIGILEKYVESIDQHINIFNVHGNKNFPLISK